MSMIGDMFILRVDMEDLEAPTKGHFDSMGKRKKNKYGSCSENNLSPLTLLYPTI